MLIAMAALSVLTQASNDTLTRVGISRRHVGVAESPSEGWEGKNTTNVALIKTVGTTGKGRGQSEPQKSTIVDLFGILLPFRRSPKLTHVGDEVGAFLAESCLSDRV